MKLALTVLAFLICLPTRAIPQAKPAEAREHNNRGTDLLNKGELDDAIAEYRQAILLNPHYIVAHNNLGTALESKGDHEGAIKEFREALRLDPNNADAHVGIGIALVRGKKDWDGAIKEYREAVRLDGKNIDAHIGLGAALSSKSNWDGEIAEEREALRLDPKNAQAHIYLGEALGAKGDVDGEIAEEREALRLEPQNQDAQADLDHALQARNSPGKKPADKVWQPSWAQFMSIFPFIGFVGGLYSLVRGLLMFREFRVLEDTPEVPIRSVAMGLVHIHGRAEGEQTVPGPVSKRPCYFYKLDIEIWGTDSKGKNGQWMYYATHADGVKFLITDATGRVLVDAHGAEFDLSWLDSIPRETATPRRSKIWSPDDRELGAYIERAKPGSPPGEYRLREFAILPQHSYNVLGTCVANPQTTGDDDRNLIVKGENEKTFMISHKSQKAAERSSRVSANRYIFWGAAVAIPCLVAFFVLAGLI